MLPPIGRIIGYLAFSMAILIAVVLIGYSFVLAVGFTTAVTVFVFSGVWVFLFWGGIYLINRYKEEKDERDR